MLSLLEVGSNILNEGGECIVCGVRVSVMVS